MSTLTIEEVKPHPHDIKGGRGNGSNMHHGNRYYQERVMENRQAYKESRGNFAKNVIAESILDSIQNRNPPGRFLESHVNDDGKEIWSIITDRNALIKKIKQALRDDKHVKRKKNSSSSASLLSDSISASAILGSSISTSPPSHANNGKYDVARISCSQEELYVNNDSSSDTLPNLSASMPPTLMFTLSPQGYASKDFSSINLNPCGYNSNYLSTCANTDCQTDRAEGSCFPSIVEEGIKRNSDALSVSLQSADIELCLSPSSKSLQAKHSLESIDIEMIQDVLKDSNNTFSLVSTQESGVQLYVSLGSAKSKDSLRSMDIEMLKDALMNSGELSLSIQSSDVQLYEPLRSAEPRRDSLTNVDIEVLEDNFFE